MNAADKIQLGKMINANKDTYIDQTELIRQVKHSVIFRKDIAALQALMAKYPDEPENVAIEAITECSFLCTYYTDIYNKIRKDEMNMPRLFVWIDCLEDIENGIHQNEASFKIGTILREIYVDSALRKANKINAAGEEVNPDANQEEVAVTKVISYIEYKNHRKTIEYNLTQSKIK